MHHSPKSRRDSRSEAARVWRPLYKTARWQRIRKATLDRDLYTCQRCGTLYADTSLLECHHVHPAQKNNPATFFDGPFETICKPCHSGPVQSEEKTGRKAVAIGSDGWPVE